MIPTSDQLFFFVFKATELKCDRLENFINPFEEKFIRHHFSFQILKFQFHSWHIRIQIVFIYFKTTAL